MFEPRWINYSQDINIVNVVKIRDNSDEQVGLLARSKVDKDGNGSPVWLFGDFIVGGNYARVCNEHKVFKVEDFQVLMGPEGYFEWVKCYSGYVPRFAVCAEKFLLKDQEPIFVGRACEQDSSDDGNSEWEEVVERSKFYRVGFIRPSHASCFVIDVNKFHDDSDDDDDDEGDAADEIVVEKYDEYEVLQVVVAAQDGTGHSDALHDFVLERMDKKQVLSELTQLYQLHFYGRNQVEFHDAISKLWVKSGLDTDFFFLPQALPWLLDLAQIHGLPRCLRQCLRQLLLTSELTTEEELREAIKLARLFKHSITNGFHAKFGKTGRRGNAIEESEDFGSLQAHLENLYSKQQKGTSQQNLFTLLMMTVFTTVDNYGNPIRRWEAANEIESRVVEDKSKEDRNVERMYRKSLLSLSDTTNRAPIPHSVIVQKEITDVGIQMETWDEQMIADELDVSLLPPNLSDFANWATSSQDQILDSTKSSTLTDFLKNMTEDQFLQDDYSAVVVPILKLLRYKCKTYSTDVIEIMSKYLGGGSNQTGRIYSVQWLKSAAMHTDTQLDEKTLTILRNTTNDPNPWIKYNARAVFATEISKQKDQWTADTFPHAGILTEFIATESIILTLAGEKPQYFTHSINLPILQLLNFYRIQHRKGQWKVTKYVVKLFGKSSSPQETLSPGWEDSLKEGLTYLSGKAEAIPRSVFEAVDKIFVEHENPSILPACALFICKCYTERQLNSEHVTLSPQFLEQLCRRLRLSRSGPDREVYLECLHVLRKWQELPDEVFQVYHIEAGAARLLSVSSPGPGGEMKEHVNEFGRHFPLNERAHMMENILEWTENYLRRGFFLSPGIIEAYMSNVMAASTKVGLAAASANGQVIPEDILCNALKGFPSSTLDKNDLELARACLKNQSLPDQILTRTWEYLLAAKETLSENSTAEACLVLICSAYLLNRKLFCPSTNSEELPNSNEKLLFYLGHKFFATLKASTQESLRETSDLFFLAKERARKDTQQKSSGPTVEAAEPSRTTAEEEFLQLIEKAQKHSALQDSKYLQRLILALRENSVARKLLTKALESPVVSGHSVDSTNRAFSHDILLLARATFVSMVTSRTENAAEECGRILELICTRLDGKDERVQHVVVTLRRLQKLQVGFFKCVENLLEKLQAIEPENSKSIFDSALDGKLYTDGNSLRRIEDLQRRDNLLQKLLSSAHAKEFCGAFTSAYGLGQIAQTMFRWCMEDSKGFNYKCEASCLLQCVEEYVTEDSAKCSMPFETKMNEHEGKDALINLLYRSVVRTLTKAIRRKISEGSSTSSLINEDSTTVLAAELLDAFHNDLPKLNSFLSTLCKVNMETMWKILPVLRNSNLDFNKLNLQGDDYDIEIETEAIMTALSRDLDKEPSFRHFLAAGLRYLLRQGCSFKALLSENRAAEVIEASIRFAAYQLDPLNSETVRLVRSVPLNNHSREQFFLAINEHIQKKIRQKPQVALSLTELASELGGLKGKIKALIGSDLLSSMREIVDAMSGDREIRLKGLVEKRSVRLKNLTLTDVRDWSDRVRRKNKKVDPIEAICVANRLLKLWRSWDLTVVQILAILLGLSQCAESNLFLELSTGSGKSAVIAIIAVMKALKGNRVDIFTSNHLLARRDAQEWKEFYSYFNLSCSSNSDEAVTYKSGLKDCYGKDIDIVYGDIQQFQFDALRTEFKGLGTRGERPYECLIMDEVDSILLDEGSKLAMLSAAFTGMDKLEPIYHVIRSTLIQFDSDQTYYHAEDILYHYKGDGDPKHAPHDDKLFEPRREYLKRNVESFTRTLLGLEVAGRESWKTEGCFQLPAHLLKYAESQVSNWAEAAVTAEALEENKDYLVVDNKVVPINPRNGVLQPSSNWTNALHQFLQIKHEVDFTPESPTTNYISNIAMVRKYKCGIVGLTGTLGSQNSHELLSEHFHADCIPIPDLYSSRFTQFPNIITHRRQEWREAIEYCTKAEVNLNRGVLVICETVKQAQSLYSALSKGMKIAAQIKLHARSDNWMEHHLQQIQPRDVIVTTNLGTRGMDIQASAIEAAGGLHVILAYLPSNTRIVRQAFGRTSRKGNVGSGHFIIKRKGHGTIDPSDIIEHVTESERSALKRFFEHELPSVTFNDQIYSDFLAQYSLTLDNVLKVRLDDEHLLKEDAQRIIAGPLERSDQLTGEKFIVLEAIQEVWAAYLKFILDHSTSDDKTSGADKLENLLKALHKAWQGPLGLFEITENYYHPTRYGFQLYRKLPSSKDPKPALPKKYVDKGLKMADKVVRRPSQVTKLAADYFKLAIKVAPTMSPAAHAGVAYVLLKRKKNLRNVGDQGANYKINASNHLRQATEMLEKDIGYYRHCQSLLSNPSTSPLGRQLTEKIRALEAYASVIEETSRTVELSLRPVQVTYKSASEGTIHNVHIPDGDVATATDFDKIVIDGHEIQLAFHGLKANKDVDGYSFQAEAAVKLLYKKLGTDLAGTVTSQPAVSLIIEDKDIGKFIGLSRANPFEELLTSSNSDGKGRSGIKKVKGKSLQWKLSNVLPTFQVKFSSINTWNQIQEVTHAFMFEEKLPAFMIIIQANEDVAKSLSCLTSLSVPDKLTSKSIGPCKETHAIRVKETNQFTVFMTDLEESTRKRLVDELQSEKVSFEVLLEGVHLEDDEVNTRSRNYLQHCSQVAIFLPRVSPNTHGADIKGRQKQIVQAVRHFCNICRHRGITPVLKFGCLDPALAKTLYNEVKRPSESIDQLMLVALRDLEFDETPSAEVLRQLEQQGMCLVASFAEKNAIPKKALALVGSVAAVEFFAGVTLWALQVPAGSSLIIMALKDMWKMKGLYGKREFSLVKYAVGKVAQVVNKGLGEVFGLLWEASSFLSSMANAESMNELETIVREQLDLLTMDDVIKTSLLYGADAARKLFFLYFQFGGLKDKIIYKIKEKLKYELPLAQNMPLLEGNEPEILWATFHAVVTVAFKKDANSELKIWLEGLLKQAEFWCADDAKDLQLLEWESMREILAGKDELFGQYLVDAIKDAVLHNRNIYRTLACTRILKEFKYLCFKLVVDVLDLCELPSDESDFIREQMKADAPSPASHVLQTLETTNDGIIDPSRLKVAKEKFQEINRAASECLRDSNLKSDIKDGFLHCLESAMNDSEVLHRMVVKSIPSMFSRAFSKRSTVVDLSASPASHQKETTSLIMRSTWEDSVIRRLMQTLRKSDWRLSLDEVPEDLSSQLPTLIFLLHETKADAVLLRMDVYERYRIKPEGNSGGPCVIIYELAANTFHINSITFVREQNKRDFTGSNLILEAVSHASNLQVTEIQPILDKLMATQDGKKMLIQLYELCMTVVKNERKN